MNCENCMGTGIVTGPGCYRGVCAECDGDGRQIKRGLEGKALKRIRRVRSIIQEVKNVSAK